MSVESVQGPAGAETDAQVLDRLLSSRFSCRAYLPRPLPDDLIAAIFDLARKTPSWCNTQPWQMVVTRPGSTEPFALALTQHARAAMDEDCDFAFPPEYRGEYLQRRREAGFALHNAVGIQRGDAEGRERQSMENYRFFGAPHVAILTAPAELGPYGAIDCGGFVASFLLAAQSLGVSSIAQAALARHSTFIRNYFALAEDRRVVCGISFGFADMAHPANAFRTTRVEPEQIFRFA